MRQLTCGVVAILFVACAPAQPQPRAQPQPQGHVVTEVGLIAVEPSRSGPPGADDGTIAIAPDKEQPAHIKLRLGHYSNAKRGIGVTIDLTERTENVADIDPAKLRFDGEQTIHRLHGWNGPRGRIDYGPNPKRNGVMLHVWDDGRRAVYVWDPDGGPSSDMIEVTRDADADPL
jgi:hypothetical protein